MYYGNFDRLPVKLWFRTLQSRNCMCIEQSHGREEHGTREEDVGHHPSIRVDIGRYGEIWENWGAIGTSIGLQASVKWRSSPDVFGRSSPTCQRKGCVEGYGGRLELAERLVGCGALLRWSLGDGVVRSLWWGELVKKKTQLRIETATLGTSVVCSTWSSASFGGVWMVRCRVRTRAQE